MTASSRDPHRHRSFPLTKLPCGSLRAPLGTKPLSGLLCKAAAVRIPVCWSQLGYSSLGSTGSSQPPPAAPLARCYPLLPPTAPVTCVNALSHVNDL